MMVSHCCTLVLQMLTIMAVHCAIAQELPLAHVLALLCSFCPAVDVDVRTSKGAVLSLRTSKGAMLFPLRSAARLTAP